MHQTSPRVVTRRNDQGDRRIAEAAGDSGRPLGRWDLGIILLLSAWVVASRVPFACDFAFMGKDGPLYIHSLALDRSYDVPMPGNIGYVLLGKLALLFWPNPLDAYAAVDVGLSILAAATCFLFVSLFVPRTLAAAATFALTANPIAWWYGEMIASYLVWLAVLPALGWFGVRFVRGRRFGDLLGASVVLGLGMILRPDLLFFGTPLWLGCLWLGRAPWKGWLIGGAILALGCACWFLGTAAVLGGLEVYLERVHAKHAGDMDGYSLARRGVFEGLLRNGSKYLMFLAWGASFVLVPAVWGSVRALRTLPTSGRWVLLALLWAGPSWYFSFFVFAGTAGLIFPILPLVYLAAAKGLEHLFGPAGGWRPVAAMTLLGLLGAAQFTLTPLLDETTQRHVILNVSFLRYTGAGVRARYNYNLDDYGVSPSLANVLRQMRAPGPIPKFPPPNLPDDATDRLSWQGRP